ncbi:MAG: T9SS type A sorting domain-containing protein, partial [Bacteroidetes bacterium]|nr:T9SS type A sorting domain-containing protein [Bacteroidota bacterium]
EQYEGGATFSFYNDMSYRWLFNKSFKTGDIIENKVTFDSSTSKWKLANKSNILKITSAGFNDGFFASIQYNLIEFVPNTFFRGIATAYIDKFDLHPYNIKIFNYYLGQQKDSLLAYLDTMQTGTVLAITGADEFSVYFGGTVGDSLKQIIKSFGSTFVDSIGWRDSWCMIGIKGDPIGSAQEVFSKSFTGTATIDTSKELLATNGYIQLPQIKNSVKWQSVFKSDSLAAGSRLDYFVRGIKSDNKIDTLGTVSFIGDSASLSFIDAEIYLQIDFVINFTANNSLESPIFKSLGVNFIPPPELATNYQVVSSTADTVLIGEDIGLSFYVYNVGESKADSFKVKVDVGNDDNSSNTIFEQVVDSLGSNERKLFTLTFNTSTGLGAKTFMIDIDSDKQIRELYEDNNFYTVTFYIKQDTSIPSLNISFDGADILDGDYISPNPEIKIELSDESLLPISDTSAITIFLNDDPIYYAINQSVLSISFNEENPKAIVTYTPELKDGDYILKVFGKNSLDNIADSSGLEKQFRVSNEVKLLEVYNYPNPTSGETYFTFKLSQIPDEVEIKIYTIAGRLIKEINIPSTDLKYDFNKVYWDGRDEDGDILGNGVYLYKVILTAGEKTEKVIQKLAIVR